MSREIAPPEVRCRWKFTRKHAVGGQPLSNVYVCPDCDSWTANMPLYKYSVCPKKERRNGMANRRQR